MGEVVALGYVVASAADLDAWSEFGQQCLGLQVVPGPDAAAERETVFFRTDDRAWRLAIEQGQDNGLVALGFEVGNEGDLRGLVARLESAGFLAKEAPELAAQRRVQRLVQVTDPSGIPLEFFYGALTTSKALTSPTGARFVTGGQGFGHAVVSVNDVEETNAFYIELLGFRLSDVITLGGLFELWFTSPSPRHHSFAYASRPDIPGGHLEHIMLEVDDLDVVGRGLDYCLDHKIGIRSMLGKHTNDRMVSFYCISPSGLTVEYGFGGRQIDNETHQFVRYDAASFWGHRPPDGRSIDEIIRQMTEAAASGESSAAH